MQEIREAIGGAFGVAISEDIAKVYIPMTFTFVVFSTTQCL